MINKAVHVGKRLLSSPRYLVILLALTFVLHVATVMSPLGSDDYLQWVTLTGSEQLHEKGFVTANPNLSLFGQIENQFNFFDPKDGNLAQLIDYGALPWWTEEDIKIHLYRPISSLTHWIDYNIWPDSLIWMHFENLLIFMLLVFIVYRLYLDTSSSKSIAALAVLFYTLDTSHVEALAWLASRNALLAPLFGVLAIHSFIKWRETNHTGKLFVSLLWLLCSLLSAEAGVATSGYLFGYMLWIDKAPLMRRIAALLPAASLVILWRVAYNYAGFGSENVAHYVDPGRDLLPFAERLIERFPLMIASINMGFDGGLRMFSLAQQHTIWIISCIITVLCFVIFYPVLKRDKYCRFWLTGALVAVIPPCAINVTSARVFEFISIGFFMVLASYVHWAFANFAPNVRSAIQTRIVRVLASFGLVAHIGLATIALVFGGLYAASGYFKGEVEDVTYAFYDFEPFDYQDRYVVIPNAPHTFLLQFVPYKLDYENLPIPAGIRTLAPGLSSITLSRLSDQELLIDVEGGLSVASNVDVPGEKAKASMGVPHLSRMLMGFFGRSNRSYSVGQQFSYQDSTIEIVELLDGRPKAIKMTSHYSLDQGKYLFLEWSWKELAYSELVLPAVGERVILSGPFDAANNLLE